MADFPIDPRELDRAALLVERISHNVDRITEAITGVETEIENVIDTTEEAVQKTQKGIYDVNYEVEQMFRRIEQRAEPRMEFGLLGPFLGADKFDKMLETLDRKMKRWADEAKRQMQARGPFSAMDKGMGLSSVGTGLGALKGQMFQGMPFGMGGLLGMALWGAAKEEQFSAAARRSLFHIQKVGGGGREELGKLSAEARSFYRAFGEEGLQILEQTVDAFTQFNVGTEQFKKATISARGFGDSISSVSTAIDLMNDAQPGTTAKLIGETMQSSGASIEKASTQVFRMAAGLRELHLNYGQFSQGIVQATSALRMQNQSLGDTTRIFEKLFHQMKARGMDTPKAAEMAMTRLQAGSAAVSGLPMGLQGLLAQDLSKQGLKGFKELKDPVALLTRFRLGLEAGGDQDFMGAAFGAIKKKAMKMGGTTGSEEEKRLRSVFALSQVGGMSEEAAAAIIDGADATEALLTPAEKSAKFTGDLNKSFTTYSARQSRFEVDMRRMQDTMAEIGGDILTFLTSSGMILIEEVRSLPLQLRSVFGGHMGIKELSGKEQAKLDVLDAVSMGLNRLQGAAVGHALEKMVDVGKIVGGEIKTTAVDRLGNFGNIQKLFTQLDQADKAVDEESGKKRVPIASGGGGRIPINAGGGDSSKHLDDLAGHLENGAKSARAASEATKKPPKKTTAPPTGPNRKKAMGAR